MKEEWRSVVGYPDYEVSNLGNIKRLKKVVPYWKGKRTLPEKIMKQKLTPDGYRRVPLSREGRQTTYFVHRLVLEAFVGPCPEGHECNHKDCNKENNSISNLEWVSHIKNQKHAVTNGLCSGLCV